MERGRAGPRLQRGGLAFDSFEEAGATFISHAGIRWPRRADRVIASDVTTRLVGARRGNVLGSPFRRPFSLGPLTLELLPAAFSPGAASLLVARGEDRLLYVRAVGSSFSLRREGAASRRCRLLVLGSIRGIGGEQGPAEEESSVEARLGAIRERLAGLVEAGELPVLVCSPLGEAAPLAVWLSEQEVAVRAHRVVHRILSGLLAAGRLKIRVLRFEGRLDPSASLLWPRGIPVPAELAGRRTHPLLVAGDAEQSTSIRAAGCRDGVAVSSRVGRQGWVEFLERCGPEQVVLPEAPPAWMADALAAREVGIEVLCAPTQIPLF